MNLKEIMAIAGKPGLYKVVAQAKNGIIVENIIDHKRIQAFTHDKISTLEEISIYTDNGDMPLKEVILKMYQKLEQKGTPDFKGDNNKIKNFFNDILPEYDKERVYVSHMQKIINWYNLLLGQNLIDLEEEVKEEEISTSEPDTDEKSKSEDKEANLKVTRKKSPDKKKSTDIENE
ncbi:MAG TPA: DUF5606 domain-containing protein [Lentimicrobium sp.]|nr:DUF5606 domain-containing protein [Lentimicrobium sp.]